MNYVSRASRVIIIALALLAAAGNAHAKRGHRKESSEELRLRLGFIYGNEMYSSGIVSASANTAFTLMQPGAKAEIEGWLPRPKLGLMLGVDAIALDYEGRPDNFQGKPMRFALAHGSLAWRISGKGGAHSSESVVSIGPAVAIFPDITTYGTSFYDLLQGRYTGGRIAMRNRIAFSPKLIFEWAGYYVQPFKLLGTSGSLSKTDSRNIGANVLFDYKLEEGISVGLGYYWGLNQMTYAPNGVARDHQIKLQTNTFLASVLFWL